MKKISLVFTLLILIFNLTAQNDSSIYSKFTTQQNRAAFYKNLVNNSILKNLSLPLNSYTEAKWQSAFSAIELINYQQPWINTKISIALDSIQYRSVDFQRSLLEMLYAGQRKAYTNQINYLINNTKDAKVFCTAAEYLLMADTRLENLHFLQTQIAKQRQIFTTEMEAVLLIALNKHVKDLQKKQPYLDKKTLRYFFSTNYLKGNVVVYSIQRKNRNYPGLSIVKDTAGNFIMDSTTATLWSVAQLARSLSNMPYYLTNGNTPQGIFRLYGMGHSRSAYIGPTDNLQLTMPFETSLQHFLKDSTIADTVWSEQWYAQLLPPQLKTYQPLYEAYYAGAVGRTEIIAHGTTVDEQFYAGQTYYPFTPTAGCLCTRENWDSTGKRIFSDQQKLSDAVKKAGGANGYLIVLELNDEQKAVSAEEILQYIQQK